MASRLSPAGTVDRERAVRIWLKSLRAALAKGLLNGYSFSHDAPSLTSARILCNREFRLFGVVGDECFGAVGSGRDGAEVEVALREGDFDALLLEEAEDVVAQCALDDEVAARLGQAGVAWQRLARGEDPRPLVPAAPEERFEQALELEWPIDGLEPLSFVLGRLMDPLSAHLEQRDRGAAVLHVRLHLVTREVHTRSLQLPAPMRDARTLRTLALLDLEANPPSAAIDRVVVAVDPTPGRVVQYSLLTRPLPSPEQLSTLMARLNALMGEGRSGAPVEVDSWHPGAFAMKTFAPREEHASSASWRESHSARQSPSLAIRRFRIPVPIRVQFEAGKPSRVAVDRRGLAGGRVSTCAGPWRTSGAWWDSDVWSRDEWDVTLQGGETYRVYHDRDSGHWFLDGIVD